MRRYAARLLFQFRVVIDEDDGIFRTVEDRIILIGALSGKDALKRAKRRGRGSEYDYRNDDGNRVHFEFVGVLDLLELGIECDDDEVWYDIRTLKRPMERRAEIIPREQDLCAIRGDRQHAADASSRRSPEKVRR